MRLVRFEKNGIVGIGAVRGPDIVDLIASGSPYRTIREIVEAGAPALAELGRRLISTEPQPH